MGPTTVWGCELRNASVEAAGNGARKPWQKPVSTAATCACLRFRRHVRVFVRKRRGHARAAHALHPPGRAPTSHASHVRAQLKGRARPVHASRMYEHSCKAERGLCMHRACTNTAVRQIVTCTCIAPCTNTAERQSVACTCLAHILTQRKGKTCPVHASRMYGHN